MIDVGLRDVAPQRAEVLLRRVELAVQRLVGTLPGAHPALGRGQGLEPESARVYHAGVDDVRFMDWAVTARTGVAHVREHVPERELDALVVVDLSPSMAFGTTRWRKRDLAAAVAAAVGVLTARPGDRLAALVFGDAPVPLRWAPRSGRAARLMLLRRLLEPPASDGPPSDSQAAPDLEAALHLAGGQLRRRGLVVVVSDLLDPSTAWSVPLRRLAHRHDVVVVEVVDPREVELVDVGVLSVRDPETGEGLAVDTGDPAVREQYALVAAEHAATVRAAVRWAGARHLRLGTGEDWVTALTRLLGPTGRGPAAAARADGWPAAARGRTA